uniref:Uncharacterized protein n=1 Tax=Myotis myotis TaxID=51298 RepID=A0A7J7VHW4_MYOMY|nr:hypothetical protein mMyoMyo1_008263 [Myotis myotis]
MVQIPEVFIIVKGISYNKLVWNLKSNKVWSTSNTSRGPFYQQVCNLDHLRIMLLDQGKQGLHCLPVSIISSTIKTFFPALTSLAQWIECWPEDSRVPGLTPVKGMYLGCRHIPSRGCAGGS